MKLLNKIFPVLAVASVAFSSCITQEVLNPVDPAREYQSDMVSVCKSYLNLSKDEAISKMESDFKRLPWSNDKKIWVVNSDETITAQYEDNKVYRVDYMRSMSHTQSQMINAALKISEDVNSFYTTYNPSTYNCGELLFIGDENRTSYETHSDFITALNDRKNDVTYAGESWGANTKSWNVYYYDNSVSSVNFKLDLGKQ